MLGRVIRVIEVPISLSLGVMRRSVELTGRIAGWALSEVASGLAPDGPRPAATRPEPVVPRAVEETPPPAPEPATAVVEQEPAVPPPPAAVVEPEPLAPASELETGAPVEPEPATSERARTPHSALNNPITEPDLTEWPDPYDHREDPRDPGEEMVFGGDAGHTPPGAISTSEPHPSQDPEAEPVEGPKRDKVDR